jgi:hypothetical protein
VIAGAEHYIDLGPAGKRWKESQQQAIADTGLAPANDSEAAIISTLAPGNYTAIVSGKANSTGVSLVEVYELDSIGRLLNISSRGFAGGDDNVIIAGVILKESDNGTICFRSLGPSLVGFGVKACSLIPDSICLIHKEQKSALTIIGQTRRRTPLNRLDLLRPIRPNRHS